MLNDFDFDSDLDDFADLDAEHLDLDDELADLDDDAFDADESFDIDDIDGEF
ncbi:MAG: hypothetical protein AAF170_06750 [Bacteroidota bacterium]